MAVTGVPLIVITASFFPLVKTNDIGGGAVAVLFGGSTLYTLGGLKLISDGQKNKQKALS
ncbi:MAG TPA: hypothetical protein VFT06_01485 [Flavisolibacter sp.]|nr:hypothetical protein [Flavisolibacter sp.]